MSRSAATATVGEALGASVDALAAAGVDGPRLDAELLLAEATGLGRDQIAADPATPVDGPAARTFAQMVRRRLGREPVAYILGRKGFRGIELAVDQRALIPRPETELLVEVALELKPARVLDVGTGSGAVALAVAEELPDCEVVATDTSPAALDLATANAGMLELAGRVRFEDGTLPGTHPGHPERFDLILANLPYVSEAEWDGLAPELTRFEPRGALVAGPTGLEAIESLLDAVSREPRPDAIALEVGQGQAARVIELVREAGFADVDSRCDLAGIERVVVGRL
jgi:release factor glutamine methyltransferase